MSQITFKDIAKKYHVMDELVTFDELQAVLQGALDDGFQKSNTFAAVPLKYPIIQNCMTSIELDKIEDDLFKRYVVVIEVRNQTEKKNGSLIVRVYQMLWQIGEDADHKVRSTWPINVNSNETKEGLKEFREFIIKNFC